MATIERTRGQLVEPDGREHLATERLSEGESFGRLARGRVGRFKSPRSTCR